jgi:hypothetical protein
VKCWEVLKEDIMEVFKEFHSRGKFEKSFNATTFVSLIHGVYKIISKVLANMLKSVLRQIVSSSHNEFFRVRQLK